MQMRRMFETVDWARRAAALRSAAIEAGKRGFATIAAVNMELAELLSPSPPPLEESKNDSYQRKGSVNRGVIKHGVATGKHSVGVNRAPASQQQMGERASASASIQARTARPQHANHVEQANKHVGHGNRPVREMERPSRHISTPS